MQSVNEKFHWKIAKLILSHDITAFYKTLYHTFDYKSTIFQHTERAVEFHLRIAQHHWCEASHHCEAHHLHKVQPRSFVPRGSNDVLASLEMMLRVPCKWGCACGANEKIQVLRLGFFGRGTKTRTLDTRFWRPLLYQLSYTPVQRTYYSIWIRALQ